MTLIDSNGVFAKFQQALLVGILTAASERYIIVDNDIPVLYRSLVESE